MQDSIIKVFVSCPGDATPEKEIIKSVCASINGVLSEEGSNFRFEVLDFRDIVAPVSGRSQEEINTRFSDYDIYIGVLWMRFGTPSGATDTVTGKAFDSGTEEEFRIAQQRYEDGNQISMYLFFKDFRAPNGKAEIVQMGKVQDFKDEVKQLGWVNNFSNNDPVGFTNNIHKILYSWLRSIENEIRQSDKKEFIESISSSENSSNIEPAQFITSVPAYKKIIPRTLSDFDPNVDPILKFYTDKTGEKLVDIINLNKHIIVLGNAGSGKSTELANVVHYYSGEHSTYIPVYHRLNTYVEQPLEDFLPQDWNEIPQNVCLLVLDGLDEVQPQHFNTAIRQILNFVTKFPDVRIVLSCRTNFYEFPSQTSNGTLPGFKIYFIDDITGSNIAKYADEDFGVDGEAFFRQAHHFGFGDLIRQPFFLNILLAKFKESGNLDIDKVSLLNEFIEQRMEFDEQHFKLTKNLKNKKGRIVELLRKLALIMEYIGKNYLSFSDLSEVFPDEKDIELIKFSTAFKSLETEPDKWGFEHNNIQEFLAASALDKLNIEEIKSFISFDGNRIKPSWVNTLFFLMSIIDQERRDLLVNWILEIEPDVLVKIEPDKVNKDTRLRIFNQIFAHYKKQNVWLRSNKFTTRELANFAPPVEANKILIAEVNSTKSSRVVKLNAVELLKHQKLNQNELEKTKSTLLSFILSSPSDPNIFFTVSGALVNLNLVNQEIIDGLMAAFGERKNQYIRTGFYRMITKAGLENNYIDYLLEGLSINHNDPDRERVNLMDEDHQLKDAFDSSLTFSSISKILETLKNPSENKIFSFRDKQDILRSIVRNASEQYHQHPELLEVLMNLYKQNARSSEELMAEIIYEFFRTTGTQLIIFKDVFLTEGPSAFEKSLLYKQLLSMEAIDFVIQEFLAHNLTNKDLLDLYENVVWFGRGKKEEEINYLTEQLNEKTDVLANREQVDFQKIRLENEQKNLALYFSIPDFIIELKRLFDSKQITEVDWGTLWKDKKYDYSPGEIRDAVFDLLVDYTRGDRKVSYDTVLEFIEQTEKFENYLFSRLKDKLKSNSELVLSDQQMKTLHNWVKDRSEKSDIVQAIKQSRNDPDSYSFNNMVMTLWHYISKYDFKISDSKILDFTTYSEPNHTTNITIDFSVIEKQAGKENVTNKVIENLKNGIDYDSSWGNNAHYVIENNISVAYPIVLKDLANASKSSYVRRDILKKYAASTNDKEGLISLLKVIGKDQLRWDIFQILTGEFAPTPETEDFLLDILKQHDEDIAERFKASKYLTQIGNNEGTNYYLNAFSELHVELNIDNYHDGAYLRLITNSDFIDSLIALLVFANKPENKQDDFDRLDNSVSEALLNVAAQSEANMLKVKKALEKFILDNTGKIEDVNFYHPMVERMEFNFYLAQSQKATVKDAIAEVEKLNK
ncbi:MAG: hypothetical protein EOO43_01580 [Flavobacterium sp.]|nr:MAG: hypothetical protein EOO43_01580 [Flavobacterium sp.]